MRIVDIHSHLLPSVDDGAKDIETTIKMLEIYKSQGITDIFATPHFMPMETTLEEFLESRKSAYDNLISELKNKNDEYPTIHLGGEIFYFTGIGRCQELPKLKLEGTNYILIELPIEPISNYLLNDIREIKTNFGLTPIIAHIERLSFQKGYKNLLTLFGDGSALAQVNALSFLRKPFDKKVKKLLTGGYISFVATDAHSDTIRPPKIEDTLNFIKNNYDYKIYSRIRENISGLFFENLKG